MAETGHDIECVAALLEQGACVAIPTETVYGLAGNALDAAAVIRLFQIKNRPSFDPVLVHIADAGEIEKYATISEDAHKLATAFWPGPLTILLEKKDCIPDVVTSGSPLVGLRCPDHPLTHKLLQRLAFPLAAPSANPFGYVSPTRAEHVAAQLGDKIPYIMDGGPCAVGIESTIVACNSRDVVLHRFGGINLEAIEDVLGKKVLARGIHEIPVAPGSLKSHYAPAIPVIVGNPDELLLTHPSREHAGVLSFHQDYGASQQIILSRSGDLIEATRNFFSALRDLDTTDCKVIFADRFPDKGLGRALNDRLQRAMSR